MFGMGAGYLIENKMTKTKTTTGPTLIYFGCNSQTEAGYLPIENKMTKTAY